jgi:O-antigen/teichoic acid export membrane protein
MRLGVWGFVLSKLIVVSCGSIYLSFLILRETGLHWNSRAAISMVRFGAPLGASYVSFFVLHFADRFFLGRYSTLAAVGNYALAYRFAFLVNALLGEPFGRSWSVTLYAYLKTPNWREEFRRLSIYLALALSVVGLGISLFADEVMYYAVPPSYHGAFLVIPVLVAAYALRDFGDFLREMLFIEKRSDLVGLTAAGVAVLNIVLNFLWIPSHGIDGAAWATLVSWLAYTLAMTLLVERQLTIGLPFRSLLALAASTSATYLLASVLDGRALFLRFAFDTLVFGIFLFGIGMSGLLSPSEKETIRKKALEALARVRKGQRPF